MNIKDGDYFSYSWKDGKGPSTDPYWCRDGRCVACTNKEGHIYLIDTYNYWPFKEGQLEKSVFTRDGLDQEYSRFVDLDKFDLDFICNLNDYELVSSHNKDDYDGVIFVGYQCTKRWAKPKGAVPSKTAILIKLQSQLAQYESEKRSAEWGIERVQKEIKEVEEIM